MKSKRAKRKFNFNIFIAIVSVIIAIASIFTFVPMQFGNTKYTGVWGAISVSNDLYSGLYAEYDIVGSPSVADINSSMETIKKTLAEQGYQSCNVLSVDNAKIRVEIGYPTTSDAGFASAYSVLYSSVSVGEFQFRSASSGEDYKVVSAKDHVKKMSVGDYNGTTYLTIEFNDAGESAFEALCKASSTVYVYMGENMQTSFSTSNVSSYSQMQLSVADYNSAKDFYFKAMYGSIKIKLNNDTKIVNTMSSVLGLSASEGYSIVFWILISLLIAVIVAGFIVLALKYRIVSLIMLPIFALDLIIAFWTFAGVSIIEFNAVSLIALVVGISLLFTCSLYYMGRIAEEYKLGKTIDASIEAGTKKARPAQISTSVLQIVLFAILAGFVSSIRSLSLILFVWAILSALSNIVVLPWLVNMFNRTNKKQGLPFGLTTAPVSENVQEDTTND